MPLKLKENESESPAGNQRPEPIVHQPSEGIALAPKTVLLIFIVLVIVVGAALLYKVGVVEKKGAPLKETVLTQRASEATSMRAPDSAKVFEPAQQPKHETVGDNVVRQEAPKVESEPSRNRPEPTHEQVHPKPETKTNPKPDAPTVGSGQFTIYIGMYDSKDVAEGESGRWKEAGYQSAVVERSKKGHAMYAVSLGRFGSRQAAIDQAEKLKDGFDAAYHVDVVK
jgi:cell division protein FtsN